VEPMTYASAGVDIERAESFVARLKARSARAGHKQMWPGAGGYASVYPVNKTTGVAVTTDGVGTKLLVAHELKNHKTIGIDLVAMVANDLICVGATPTMFLDYFAVGKLQDAIADDIMEGIIEGCDRAGMILAGGETAEMPGLYEGDHYDLAGFAVGHVEQDQLLTGDAIKPGMPVIGVGSSGVHSNGLSLARKALADNREAYEKLLVPTYIYVRPAVECLKQKGLVAGICHITGGGWRNLFRLNHRVGYYLDAPLAVPEVLGAIAHNVALEEMYRTFNMGMGLCVIAAGDPNIIVKAFRDEGFVAQVVGRTTDQNKSLFLEPLNMTINELGD
jgi:phosphoribosylformylglycinamidine cyclo-ligase